MKMNLYVGTHKCSNKAWRENHDKIRWNSTPPEEQATEITVPILPAPKLDIFEGIAAVPKRFPWETAE